MSFPFRMPAASARLSAGFADADETFQRQKRSGLPGALGQSMGFPGSLFEGSSLYDYGAPLREPPSDFYLIERCLRATMSLTDARETTEKLLDRFGNMNAVVSARPSCLVRTAGLSREAIDWLKFIGAVCERVALRRIMGRPYEEAEADVMSYLHLSLDYQPLEQVRLLYLDEDLVLIGEEKLAEGTVDHVPVYPREVARHILEMEAAGIVLVHNHPSGDPAPSESDVSMTLAVRDAIETVGLFLYDHLIIGHSGHVSLRQTGLV